MNRYLIVSGIVVLLICGVLSGCVSRRTPVSEGVVYFNIEEVVITNELELFDSWANETTNESSDTINFIIITIKIENLENQILEVQESFTDGLKDDEDNVYWNKRYVDINDSTYSVDKITQISENEVFGGEILGISEDFSPNSTAYKKLVYMIPIDREPSTLRLGYGFKANELTNVERWYHTTLDL
jgi:hypothetical protein